ncbi:MAG: VOC family protein [Candidatus Pacebacteria bacterium]|nr:VOC family protein [Candidatus Paceibacterota bacterium]
MRIHELGHIVLYVSRLETSANFYRDVLGFEELHRDLHTAFYSSGRTHHEMLLIEVGGEKKEKTRPEPGLYHIGFKIGDTDDELRAALNELKEKDVPIVGTANHHVTHSLYILDPDGNELELYIDVDDSWKKDSKKLLQPVERLVI